VADCPIGSLAADALCAWSGNGWGNSEAGFEVCLLPTRSLGGGVAAGVVDAETVATVIPDDKVATLFLTAAQLADTLGAAERAAWTRCSTFDESESWQVSGAALSVECSQTNRPPVQAAQLRLRSRAGELVAAGAAGLEAPVPVVTLSSALPLLPTPAEPAIERHISLRQVVADYLQAHSPLNYSAALNYADARIEHGASCGRAACGAADFLDRPILPAPEGPSGLSSALGAIAAVALLGVLAVGLLIWRRRRGRQALASPRRGERAHEAETAVPELAAQPRAVGERTPLKTGSTRLTSSSQLAQ